MVDQSDLVMWAAIGVAVVAAFMLLRLGRRAAPQADPARASPAAPAPPQADENLLLKFVQDSDGNRRGETVAFEGNEVVMKGPQGFFLVPADRLKLEGDTVRVVGHVEWDAARAAGEAWRTRSTKVIEYSESELPKD